ncbi:MAG: SRPBCC domain-containing protein [Candidatus Gracilibacteria bacterium]|nr:SRPBCC domain-containing protein [Candidatus Gracilibacteria bacterium]
MKEQLHFEIEIDESTQKVWDTMLTLETYKIWTSIFDPSSYYEGNWEKGSEIHFLGSDGNGMLSKIAENTLYKFISIKHLGMLVNGVVDTTSDNVLSWIPSYENYTFTEKGSKTLLEVDLELPSTPEGKEMKDMFEGMWPNALLKLKELCEGNA